MNNLYSKFIAGLTLASAGLLGNAWAQPVTQVDSGLISTRGVALVPNAYRYEPILNQPSAIPAGVFNSNMIFVADQLDRNVATQSRTQATVITSFVFPSIERE